MNTHAIIATAAVSLISLVGVTILSLNEQRLRRNVFVLVSLAVGALLGDAFIHIIPEALEADKWFTSILVIVGILLFFILEKFLHWHHHGDDMGEKHIHPVGKLVLISDGFHNFLDGIIIGTSFMAGTEIGIATTIAVVLHEIPQEIGDFAVLIHAGYTKRKAIILNFLSALLAFAGLLVSFLVADSIEHFETYALPITAGGFIYIALSDLIPELHKNNGRNSSILQILMIGIGVAAMIALTVLE